MDVIHGPFKTELLPDKNVKAFESVTRGGDFQSKEGKSGRYRSISSVFFYRGPLGSLARTPSLLLGSPERFSYILFVICIQFFEVEVGSVLQDYSKKLGEGQEKPDFP